MVARRKFFFTNFFRFYNARALYRFNITRHKIKATMGTTSTSEEKISVSVRVRPLNDAEKDLGCAWRHVDDAIVLDATSVRFSYSPSLSLSLEFEICSVCWHSLSLFLKLSSHL